MANISKDMIQYASSNSEFQLGWRMSFKFLDGRAEIKEIGYPLTVEFDINRFGDDKSCGASFRIYNLSRTTRDLLFKPMTDYNSPDEFVIVTFEAGYNNKFSTLYHGILYECNSYKSAGSPDIITDIFCFDTRPLLYTYKTYSAGTPVKEIIQDIVYDTGLTVKAIGNFSRMISIPYTTSGKAIDEINTLTGNSAYIDNGELLVLNPDEVVNDKIIKFNSTNIFGTPQKEGVYLKFKTKFCPEIAYTQLIEVLSDVQPQYNGILKCMGIKHSGSISGGVPCSVETELLGYYGQYVKDLPVNITDAPIYSEEDEANNARQKDNNVKYKKVTRTKVKPITTKDTPFIQEIWKDIKANGLKAKSLSQKVGISGTNILWGDLVQAPNLSGSAKPNRDHLANAYNTLYYLAKLISEKKGNNVLRGLEINSGWRSESNNTKVGGVSGSSHLIGKALDFAFTNANTRAIYNDVIKKNWTYGFTDYYPKLNQIHVSLGDYKYDSK